MSENSYEGERKRPQVLLLGLDKATAARARKAFDSGRVKKCYLAILEGVMEESELMIDEPIARYEGPATLPPRGKDGTHGGAADFRMMCGHGGLSSHFCVFTFQQHPRNPDCHASLVHVSTRDMHPCM